jgi:acetyltransferase-like isoleucine patch superfamily enzyme
MGLGRTLYSWCGLQRLRWQGVRGGTAVRLFGLPLVTRAAGSAIHLGRGVALCSRARWNPVGVNHPVILRTLFADAEIRIGDATGLSGATVCAARSVCIGRDCLIGANVVITDYDFHAVAPAQRRTVTARAAIGCAPVVIEDNVWIGMNAIVLKGVRIGRNSVIAAGSIVTHSIPENCVAGGNPARPLRLLDSPGA